MPRKKPFSAKQRRAQIQTKRAEKRGETDLAPARVPASSRPRPIRPGRSGPPTEATSHKLQSKFIALTPAYLEKTRNSAFNDVLERPIPGSAAVFPVEELTKGPSGVLTCPARPKFRFGQTKKEVEKNEEGWFRKWSGFTEGIVRDWVEGEELDGDVDEGDEEEGRKKPIRSPSWFETNLEVWRQLWRVTETSQIILLLLDSRCPPLHCPPSLRSHIQALKPRKEIILVLTKSDLVDQDALAGWKVWVKGWWGQEVEVVGVMSYDVHALYEDKKHTPRIPQESLGQLITALQRAHGRLLEPPERIKEDPEKLQNWSAPVRRHVDWAGLVGDDATSTKEQRVPATLEASDHADSDAEEQSGEDKHPAIQTTYTRNPENEPLTIGLIGQPNVGKSSLLNAIFGASRVRASKTPGKTKHFQTLFWGVKREIRVVDCPGLVCPSLIGLEMQALAGILPISQIPSLPACIHHAARHLPIEEIFHIPPPDLENDTYADKRTWRDPTRGMEVKVEKGPSWTAGIMMEQRALDRGFITAKGGRPDSNRASNGMMRSLAEGKVRWGFWPPDINVEGRRGKGIWLGDYVMDDDEVSDDEGGDGARGLGDGEVTKGEGSDESTEEESGEDEGEDMNSEAEEAEDKAGLKPAAKVGGFFAALEIDEGDDDTEDEEDKEDVPTGGIVSISTA